ncbi:hypothetical protein LTR64_002762 [Lithohypha guttulata]|uniref:uncharacterized protein n=1 Tax=Lithohypha guttulata TaxID=1690604 RepID=UPI002DE07908|nr:hypothetical protein LTR51_001013 [Lithohypha guttulata]
MTISPPESNHNSDDEETRGRSRQLEKENLAELQAAIRGIRGERKSGSPIRTQETIQVNGKAASEGSSPAGENRLPLSSSQKRVSHSRSSTDSNIVFEVKPTHSHSPPQPILLSPKATDSESDESDGIGRRPPMVRKKSGELVKPALRPHSRRRPSSMPGTPTYNKAVHFDSQLEHIRHFLQVDRPLAVSAGSSPAENYESESEFPFGSDEASARSRGPSFEWEIRLANSPEQPTEERKALPVHVERVFLSADKKNLIGVVVVKNLAFQKHVTARFTLDYWKTTSEVAAEFSDDLSKPDHPEIDRFTFSISLADQANLENKTLFFCVRYNVNGQEHWDSNNLMNYQVDFIKKVKAKPSQQPTGLGARPLNALPRSRPSPPTSNGRPKSMPISFDDFASGFDNYASAYSTSPTSLIGEPKIKLRSPRSKQELVPDVSTARRSKGSSQMFGHRYDFNSSLSAAKNSAYALLGEHSGLPPMVAKQSTREIPVVAKSPAPTIQKLENGVHSKPLGTSAPAVTVAPVTPNPALFSEKPALTSQSYQELVDKYCFFGTAKSSPIQNAGLVVRATDGTADDGSISDADSIGSAESSGASTPVNQDVTSSPPSELSSVKSQTPTYSRASSPLLFTGSCSQSGSNSPAFGYSHPTPSQTLMAEAPQATVILG